MIGSIPPKVNVCIPVYNGSAYIGECIESVLTQTYKNFRLIICDNCSTDSTEEIVQSFHDSRIAYFRNERNLGISGNMNRCLSLADGEYVCILHHDDAMLPENLERKVRVLDENPRVGFVHSNLFIIDQDGRVLREFWEDSKRDYIESGLQVFHRYINHMPLGALVFIGAVLARRRCYEQLGGFRPDLPITDDNEMWMRITLFYDVACIRIPLVKWRQHSNSESYRLGLFDVKGLQEHHLATKIILSEYRNRIPDWRRLRQQVFAGFAKEAFIKARQAYWNGNFPLSKRYLKFEVWTYPKFLRSREFWWLVLKLLAGPKGGEVYRLVKKRLRGKD